MLVIDDLLVSENLLDVHFVCDLEACKGACCVEGDLGAPLELDELSVLEEIYPLVAHYIPEKARQAIATQGKYIVHADGSATTPLVNGRECVYTVFRDGKAFCGIEMAHRDGKINYLKPISCHLYPIRIKHVVMMQMDALNYDHWHVCRPACKLGTQMRMPLYKFLKSSITRKFGEEFYVKLCEVLEAYKAARG
jgi:Protein of unknown function (DUF3109)